MINPWKYLWFYCTSCRRGHTRFMLGCLPCRQSLGWRLKVKWFGLGVLATTIAVYAAEALL